MRDIYYKTPEPDRHVALSYRITNRQMIPDKAKQKYQEKCKARADAIVKYGTFKAPPLIPELLQQKNEYGFLSVFHHVPVEVFRRRVRIYIARSAKGKSRGPRSAAGAFMPDQEDYRECSFRRPKAFPVAQCNMTLILSIYM